MPSPLTKEGDIISLEYKRFSPIEPGSLNEQTALTFASATYDEITIPPGYDLTVNRVWGGKAEKVGRYMSDVPQNGGMQSQLDLALNPAWGNTAGNISSVVIPGGQKSIKEKLHRR